MSALVLTIDTEPDLPKRRQSTHSTLRNIPELRTLQQRIPDIRLTLLVTQSVLDDADSLRELKRLNDEFNCEIGAHLHPEDTPPFVSAERRETSLMRLPPQLRAQKLDNLIGAVEAHFPRPTSYRAGRWKLSPEDFALLDERGFLVDSSVTPYISWQLEDGPDFSAWTAEPRRVEGDLWEVPVTVGLNRGSSLAAHPLVRSYLRLFSHPANSLPFPLDQLWTWARPLRPVWLRPTYTPLGSLKRLGAAVTSRSPDSVLNMMFHSNELVVGGRPFIREQADVDRIVDRIVAGCRYFVDELDTHSTTLSESVVARARAEKGMAAGSAQG